jgi:hypothetical protein
MVPRAGAPVGHRLATPVLRRSTPRVAAFRHRRFADAFDQLWQRRALAEGWRPPTN